MSNNNPHISSSSSSSPPISPSNKPNFLLNVMPNSFSTEGLSRVSTDVLNEYNKRMQKATRTESLDFEEPDGDLLREHYKKQTPRDLIRHDLMGYVVVLIIALLVASIRLVIYYITEYILHWRATSFSKYFNENNATSAWGFAFGTSLLFAIPTSCLILFEPGASGSGMPEVLAYLNGVAVEKFTTWRTLIFKVIGMVGIVSAGLFSGFEGPMSHVGTIMGILLTKYIRKSKILTAWFYGESASEHKGDIANILHVTEKRIIRIFAATGAAIGLAAAFHAPLASTLFVIEEAASSFEMDLIIRTLFACIVAYLLVGAVSILKKGYNIKHISQAAYSVFAVNATCTASLAYQDVAMWIFMGFLFGVSGHFYNKIIVHIREVRAKRLVPYPYLRLVEIVLVCLITSLVVIFVPRSGYFEQCSPPLQVVDHIQSLITKPECQATCYTDMATVIANNPTCYTDVCLPDALYEVYSQELFNSFQVALNTCSNLTDIEQASYTAPQVNLTNVVNAFNPDECELLTSPQCEYHGYLELATLLFASPERILTLLFNRGMFNLYQPATLAVFGVLYIFLSLMIHGIALPTDLVIPNLIIGATAGRLLGIMTNFFKKRLGQSQVDPGAYALLGMAGFWSGTSRLLVTVMLIAVESTFELNYLPALLIVCLVATVTGNFLGGSMYHMEIHSQKLPYLPYEPPHQLKSRRIDNFMSMPVMSVTPKVSLSEVKHILENSKHSGFPVVNDRHEVLGLLLRSQLNRKLRSLLSDGNIHRDNDSLEISGIMNNSPLTAVTGTTASKAYIEFRTLALRHLLVVNYHHQLMGIVTRKDFLNEVHGLHNHHLLGTLARHSTLVGNNDSNSSGGGRPNDLNKIGRFKTGKNNNNNHMDPSISNYNRNIEKPSTTLNQIPGNNAFQMLMPNTNISALSPISENPTPTHPSGTLLPGFDHEMKELKAENSTANAQKLHHRKSALAMNAKSETDIREGEHDDSVEGSETSLIHGN